MTARYPMLIAACLAAAPLQAQPEPGDGDTVRRDLVSVFEPGASLEEGNSIDLTAARGRLRTRPYATSTTGLCRRDDVILGYAGPDSRSGRATLSERATIPFGVTAESWFRMVRNDPPGLSRDRPVGGECAGLDRAETRGWFRAPNVYVATDGYRAFAAALQQLHARGRRIAGCRESTALRFCREQLPPASLERIVSIDRCQAAPPRFCFTIGVADDITVTLRTRYGNRPQAVIERIDIEGPEIIL